MLTPDGVRYLAAAERRVARPFHWRWMIPALCRTNVARWQRLTRTSTWLLLPATWWYVGGWAGVAAAACVCGLSGVWKFNRRWPVLVDAPGMLCALLAADCMLHGLWYLAIPLALLGGTVRETSPVFAALYAWNPLLLIGLLAPALRTLQREGPDVLDEENRWILDHPIKASRKYHAGFPIAIWVLPWGAAPVALGNPTLWLYTTLAAAYGQCLVATDTVRLFMWAFPVVLASAVQIVPPVWLVLFVVAHLANPFAGEGG